MSLQMTILSFMKMAGSSLNPLPNAKVLDETKFKAFADDKLSNKKIIVLHFIRVENIVAKGENAGYQHFLLFPQCFQKPCFQGASKGVIVWEWVKELKTLWEKEKLLIFSFSHHVFQRLLLQTLKNQGLFRKGLT